MIVVAPVYVVPSKSATSVISDADFVDGELIEGIPEHANIFQAGVPCRP